MLAIDKKAFVLRIPAIPSNEDRIPMKIPDCDRCLLNAHNPYLVCAVHPEGVETDKCPDFRLDQNMAEEELWSPEGYYWYDGELIPISSSRLTKEEKLEILDTHPFFTGICPNCGQKLDSPQWHWECSVCGESG
jgi:hypothetical protein